MINAGEGEGILRASLVEVFETDTQASGFVLLWYHHQVCQPVRMFDFSNESGLDEFGQLLPHGLSLGFGKAPQCLLDRLVSLQHIEAMFGQPAWDSWHVRRVPGEYVPIVTQESHAGWPNTASISERDINRSNKHCGVFPNPNNKLWERIQPSYSKPDSSEK